MNQWMDRSISERRMSIYDIDEKIYQKIIFNSWQAAWDVQVPAIQLLPLCIVFYKYPTCVSNFAHYVGIGHILESVYRSSTTRRLRNAVGEASVQFSLSCQLSNRVVFLFRPPHRDVAFFILGAAIFSETLAIGANGMLQMKSFTRRPDDGT